MPMAGSSSMTALAPAQITPFQNCSPRHSRTPAGASDWESCGSSRVPATTLPTINPMTAIDSHGEEAHLLSTV